MNIIDELLPKRSVEHVILDTNVQGVNINHVNMELQPCTNTNTNSKQLSSIPPNIGAHIPDDTPTTQLRCDVSIPDKEFES